MKRGYRKKLVKRLRGRFGLGKDIPTEEVLRATDGTIGRAYVELGMAVDRLTNEMISQCLKKKK